MITMQYSVTLPADYDMGIIRQRIASKGHLLDDYPRLVFKAFLYACRQGGAIASRDNLYAPFYLWEDSAGMDSFLCGEGFASLTQSFGWPAVDTWAPWQARLTARLSDARFASCEIVRIAPHSRLAELRERESEAAIASVDEEGALAAVVAFEPGSWSLVRFHLWRDAAQAEHRTAAQWYELGHLSMPGVARHLAG